MTDFDLNGGIFLIRLARSAVEEFVITRKRMAKPIAVPRKLLEKHAAFVTINKIRRNDKRLRGCVGIYNAEKPLVDVIIDSSCDASFRDPRFPPISEEELDLLVIEISVLTPPELIQVSSPKELPKTITIGEHGLIVKWNFGSGLVLPQVAIDYGWEAKEFLSETCMKAGATPDLWLTKEAKIYRFSSEIFAETSPRGEIIKVKLPIV